MTDDRDIEVAAHLARLEERLRGLVDDISEHTAEERAFQEQVDKRLQTIEVSEKLDRHGWRMVVKAVIWATAIATTVAGAVTWALEHITYRP